MNHDKKSNFGRNAYIGPSTQILTEINQDMRDANQAALTNAAILKNKIRQTRLNQFRDFKNEAISELKDLPQDLLEAKKWNALKNDAKDSFEEMGSKTITKLKQANDNLNHVGKTVFKRSSQTMSLGKDFISKNTPKVSKTFGESVKSLIHRRLHQKELDLLTRLSQLKDAGVLTQKEFNSKKKKILEAI